MGIRITGGEHRGVKLSIPKELDQIVRPTQDKVRQAIFSSIISKVEIHDLRVLDLFSGTGIMSFEALSRGASSATMVDFNQRALNSSKPTAVKLKIEDKITQVLSDCMIFIGTLDQTYDLIFIDPPYRKYNFKDIILALVNNSALSSSGILIYEEDLRFFNSQYEQSREIIATHFSSITLKAYGSTSVAFLRI